MAASASSDRSRLRIRLAPGGGQVSLATGLTVLDHLLGLLAEWGRFDLELETAPIGAAEQEVEAVARALGGAFTELLVEPGYGSGVAPVDEALAQVVLVASGRPLIATNVDLSSEHVGGLGTDFVAEFLDAFADEAGLTLHVRLLEGEDPQHVLEAIFVALGIALRQACSAR